MSSEPSPGAAPRPRRDVLPPKDRLAADFEAVRREEEELGSKLTIVVFVRVILVTLALVVLFVSAEMRLQTSYLGIWQYALVALTYVLSILYALLLRFSKVLLPLAYAQIVIDTTIVSTLVLMTGGLESVFSFAYVLTVLGASITLYRRGTILAAVCYFLMFGTVVLVQIDPQLGLLPEIAFGRAMFSFMMHASSIVLVGVLSAMLAEQLRVTGRRLAEKQDDYERLEELHAAILRSLPAGLMTIDPDGMIRYANDAALGILKAGPEAVVGHPLSAIVPTMATTWQTAAGTGLFDEGTHRQRFEATHLRRDGRAVRIGFSFAPLGPNEGSGSIAVFQDVTEIVRLKNAYERAERLATVGKMAAGLAHEVRNPLASVCASIDVMKQALDPPEPMKRLMTNIVKEADRLNALITDFLEFARPRPPNKQRTDLSALVASVVDVLKNDRLLSTCQLEVSLTPDLHAAIDADQVRQVIWNLARNAAEAMSASSAKGAPKTLTITTRRRGDAAELSIQDTGPGIDPEGLKRIFDPFFTTKERGSGLGLAITHSIVESHGGRILVESKPGEGTEVTVAFPFDELESLIRADTFRASASDADLLGGTVDTVPRLSASRVPRS